MERPDTAQKLAMGLLIGAGAVLLATLLGLALSGYGFVQPVVANIAGICVGGAIALILVRPHYPRARGVKIAAGVVTLYLAVSISNAFANYLPGWLALYFHANEPLGAFGVGLVLGIAVVAANRSSIRRRSLD